MDQWLNVGGSNKRRRLGAKLLGTAGLYEGNLFALVEGLLLDMHPFQFLGICTLRMDPRVYASCIDRSEPPQQIETNKMKHVQPMCGEICSRGPRQDLTPETPG